MSNEAPEDMIVPDAVEPRHMGAIVAACAVVGLMLVGTLALWAHYGSAVFFETIRAGLSACFG